MAHGPYPATFLLKDPTGVPIRGTYDTTEMPTLHHTQRAHVRSMAILVKVAFILLVTMRGGCVLVTMIKESMLGALT